MQHDRRTLERIRTQYLNGTAGNADYWQSADDLAAYDATFAQRIGWKWNAVLNDLDRLEWKPPAGAPLIDIGCGSGIASRTVLRHYGSASFASVHLHDRSPLAMRYAAESITAGFAVHVTQTAEYNTETLPVMPSDAVVVLSHILTELTAVQAESVVRSIANAAAVLWVEPGTQTASNRLVAVRTMLQPQFGIVAPCTQQCECPMNNPVNARHWCHAFAAPPAEAFTESGWSQFADDFGIDLSRLAYSHCIFDKRAEYHTATAEYRILGTPNVTSADAVACVCNGATVSEIIAAKKRAPSLYKALKKGNTDTPRALNLHGRNVVE
ncbi:MAG: hypothetical protein JNL32_00825 [Candidatus Kapabacteria bacterium]|nr:hypothetical protein [Candidatus Kapabacteria bacterium]